MLACLAIVGSEKVNETARSAHGDLGSPLELRDLVADACAAVEADGSEPERLRQAPTLVVDLQCELARGREDDTDRAVALFERRLIHHVAQHRQHERQRLARARLRDPDHVAPTHDDRQCLRLDRRRLLEAAPSRPKYIYIHVFAHAYAQVLVNTLYCTRTIIEKNAQSKQNSIDKH